MTLEWKDDYATGVEKVDEQHGNLFAFLNDLEELIAQEIDSGPEVDNLLTSLATDTQTHFSFEEQCMNQNNCPVAGDNKKAHEQFLHHFGSFQRERRAKGPSVSSLEELHKTTERWVVNHICNVDIHLKSCVGDASVRPQTKVDHVRP